MSFRTRYSIQDLIKQHDAGETAPLENLIIAFRAVQALDPGNEDSFEQIAGYHGEPFREQSPVPNPEWWGGYCPHASILFPTWHRAYVLRLEEALQKHGPDPNIAMPFWDETADVDGRDPAHPHVLKGIPTIFTDQQLAFKVENSSQNPFYSYKLKQALDDNEEEDTRYSKPAGYDTVRYPLSGLVGNPKDAEETERHNHDPRWSDPADQAKILNSNVKAWLEGTVKIDTSGGQDHIPDTYSVYSHFIHCLKAPNYAVFSNTSSAGAFNGSMPGPSPDPVVPLEAPHNAMHLAVGGFYQPAVYNADEIRGANGDMGDNQTASFDPIFFFHHCFIDYVFWQWQGLNGCQTKIEPIRTLENDPGFISTGLPYIPLGEAMSFQTPLRPFTKSNSSDWYTSDDLVDIEGQLGYTYGPGSLTSHPRLGAPLAKPKKLLHVHDINRADYPGSFVIRTYANDKKGKSVEIGRSAVLSRLNLQACRNCQNHLTVGDHVPLHKELLKHLAGEGEHLDKLNVKVKIQTHKDVIELHQPKIGWTH